MKGISCAMTFGLAAMVIDSVTAGAQDLCTPGSDSECARFGEQMCCAHIEYTFKGDNQDFHACASKPGIEFTNGMIVDNYGFSGRWYCNNAISAQTTLLAAAAIAAVSMF